MIFLLFFAKINWSQICSKNICFSCLVNHVYDKKHMASKVYQRQVQKFDKNIFDEFVDEKLLFKVTFN